MTEPTEVLTCKCGAVYQREIQKDTVRDIDSFNCVVCGCELKSWSTSRWPHYFLISKPNTPNK